jgi:hypothetical protein
MPNSLLYIDNTIVQEYTKRNETLAKYLDDKKEKDLDIAETASEEYKTENHEEPHQKPSEELQEEAWEEPHHKPRIVTQEENQEETQEEPMEYYRKNLMDVHQEESEKEPEEEPEKEPKEEPEEEYKEDPKEEPEEGLKENLEDNPEERNESHMVIQKMQTDYPKIDDFGEESLYDEFDAPEKTRAASEVHAQFRKELSKNFDNLEISRPRGQTTTHIYSKDDLMNMANYYLPIEKRIFKSQNSSLDLAVSSTMITALRNFMNDGRSKQTTLTKAGSFTYEDLSHLQEEIENTAQNKKLN